METVKRTSKTKHDWKWVLASCYVLLLAFCAPFVGLAFVHLLNVHLDEHSEVIRCEVVGTDSGEFNLYAVKPRSRYILAKGLKTTTEVIDTRADLCPFPKYPKCTGSPNEVFVSPAKAELAELWNHELLTWMPLSIPSELSGTSVRRTSLKMG